GVAYGMQRLQRPILLAGERPHRIEDPLRFISVVVVDDSRTEFGANLWRRGRHDVDGRVLVFAAEKLLVRGNVGQHALRVVAAVDGEQDVHVRLLSRRLRGDEAPRTRYG